MPPIPRPAGSLDYSVEFQAYIDVLRRRRRFVAISLILFLSLAVIYSFTRTPVYTATSEVLIQSPSTSQTYRPDQLVSLDTEARLVTSAPIAVLAKETLDSPLSISDLLEHVSVETTPDTLVLDILYWATDPKIAAAGADAFARAYLQYRQQSSQESLTQQRRVLQDLIDQAEAERDRQNSILEQSAPDSAEFRNAQSQRDTLNGQIAILTAQLAQIPVTVDPGQVILPANPPESPSSPNHLIDVGLGIFVGVLVGGVGAFVRDRVDERIRTRSDLEACLRAPVLAVIPRISGMQRHGPSQLVTENQPESAGAEAFRTLRTSVMAMGRQRQVKVIAIVGATLGEGKTSTTANLASALAHADNRVLAISADLRKPRLHEFFGLANSTGLSDLLTGESRLQDAIREHDTGLSVISSGAFTDRPAELLESDAMEEVLRSVRESFDFVLIDTPPVLGLADTLAIAPLADAILLVAHADTSRRSAVSHAEDQLDQVGATIHGCVLTNVTIGRDDAHRYGYGQAYGAERAPVESLRTSLRNRLREPVTHDQQSRSTAPMKRSRRDRSRASSPELPDGSVQPDGGGSLRPTTEPREREGRRKQAMPVKGPESDEVRPASPRPAEPTGVPSGPALSKRRGRTGRPGPSA